jgi:hypothetical protein
MGGNPRERLETGKRLVDLDLLAEALGKCLVDRG